MDTLTPAEIERLLQEEQGALASLIDDAVAALGGATKQQRDASVERGMLKQRADALSLGARIAARVLTKVRLDTMYPPTLEARFRALSPEAKRVVVRMLRQKWGAESKPSQPKDL